MANSLPRVAKSKNICHAWQTICHAWESLKTFATRGKVFATRGKVFATHGKCFIFILFYFYFRMSAMGHRIYIYYCLYVSISLFICLYNIDKYMNTWMIVHWGEHIINIQTKYVKLRSICSNDMSSGCAMVFWFSECWCLFLISPNDNAMVEKWLIYKLLKFTAWPQIDTELMSKVMTICRCVIFMFRSSNNKISEIFICCMILKYIHIILISQA